MLYVHRNSGRIGRRLRGLTQWRSSAGRERRPDFATAMTAAIIVEGYLYSHKALAGVFRTKMLTAITAPLPACCCRSGIRLRGWWIASRSAPAPIAISHFRRTSSNHAGERAWPELAVGPTALRAAMIRRVGVSLLHPLILRSYLHRERRFRVFPGVHPGGHKMA